MKNDKSSLNVSATSDKGAAGCSVDTRPALLTESEGQFRSPSDENGFHYPDNADCQWRITVPEGNVRNVLFIYSLHSKNPKQIRC